MKYIVLRRKKWSTGTLETRGKETGKGWEKRKMLTDEVSEVVVGLVKGRTSRNKTNSKPTTE